MENRGPGMPPVENRGPDLGGRGRATPSAGDRAADAQGGPRTPPPGDGAAWTQPDERDQPGKGAGDHRGAHHGSRRRARRVILIVSVALVLVAGGLASAAYFTANHYLSGMKRIHDPFSSIPAAARPALFGGVVLGATAALALLLIWRLPAGQPGSAAVRPAIALALAWLAVFPVQTPWYDALVFPLLALMPWSRLDYLVVIRCLLLSEMLLPGVQANSGSLSVAIAEVSHLGLAALVGLLVVACLLRAWGGERSRYSSSASVSCSPDAAPPITGRDDNRMSAAQQAVSNGAVTECN